MVPLLFFLFFFFWISRNRVALRNQSLLFLVSFAFMETLSCLCVVELQSWCLGRSAGMLGVVGLE